jgi:3-oxoacyl-[acyl-carrier-protein] synthase III
MLASTARYVPERELTNDALRAELPADARGAIDKLEAATGIRTRFVAPPSWAASDLALPAARLAIDRAGLTADDLDVVIVGTDTPDYLTPATSVVLQHKLGAQRAGTFDVGCACASFPTAIATAAGLVATNAWVKHVLVVGSYAMHRFADPADPTRFFYGDGASAVILRAGSSPGVIATAMRADGSFAPRWGIFAGGSADPTGRPIVRFVEPYPPEVNERGWPLIVRELAARGGFSIAEIDLAIFTQVRSKTIRDVMAALELPAERTHEVMGTWGYTGSACIGMALDDAFARGKAGPGSLVVLVGSGVGYNQAGVALQLGDGLH